jgi:ribonuclease P protein component
MNNSTPEQPTRFRFGPQRRIRKNADFQRILAARNYNADSLLVIYSCPNDLGYCRLGVAVGRKFGGAVARNRYKRIIREAFRLSQHDLTGGYDIIVMPRLPADKSSGAARRPGPRSRRRSKIPADFTLDACRRSLIRLYEKLNSQ